MPVCALRSGSSELLEWKLLGKTATGGGLWRGEPPSNVTVWGARGAAKPTRGSVED